MADMKNSETVQMKLLHEIKNFDNSIPGNILPELAVYSRFNAECTKADNGFVHRFYVPADEMDFYEQWKEKAASELLLSNQNAVLIEHIARRHGIKLPK